MYRRQAIVLGFAIALIAASTGCSHHGQSKGPTTRMARTGGKEAAKKHAAKQDAARNETAFASEQETSSQTAPAVATDNLAGAWQLAVPRQNQRQATITATDANRITIETNGQGGVDEDLSGNYLVEGNYLLILTRDQRLRTLAWKINSPDSLTIVRSPERDEEACDYRGITLVRAPDSPSDAKAFRDDDARENSDEQENMDEQANTDEGMEK